MAAMVDLVALGLRPALLTRQQAAAYLGVSVRRLYTLSTSVNPEIGYIRLGGDGDKRYPVELLDGYIARCIQTQVPHYLLAEAA